MAQVLQLSQALIDRALPAGVTDEQARRRLAELKVELYGRTVSENPDDTKAGLQLMGAREDLARLDGDEPDARWTTACHRDRNGWRPQRLRLT